MRRFGWRWKGGWGLVLTLLTAPMLAAATEHAPFTAAELATAAELRAQALADDRAWEVVAGLTTEVGARLAGGPNDQKARDWMVARFKALGFDRVWTEPVDYPVWERGAASLLVTSGPEPVRLDLAALGGSMGTPAGGLRTSVVRFESLEALSAVAPGQLSGQIAFVDQKMERARDGRGYGAISKIRVTGASVAAGKGAAAFLLRSAGTDAGATTPHTGMMRYENTPTRIPAAALSNESADRLAALIAAAPAEQPVELKLELAARVRAAQPYTGANVIAEVTGRERPDEFVVIGGHLDSWDLGTGAIDDGAGVAVTTAAAALIGALATPPRRSIRVIAWANEEQGVYGGKAYAAARAGDGTLPQQTIAAESDFGAGRIYALNSKVGAAALPAIAAIAEVLQPLGIALGNNEASGGADVGDLGRAGVPIAALSQDGTHYFDWHHTAADTLDKIDPEALRQNVAAWVVFSYLAAEYEPGFR